LRIESAKAAGLANTQTEIDVASFTQWVDAYTLAHMRNLIEDLAVRLARQYPDNEELSAGMLANVDRIDGEIPPGGMPVPLFHHTATDEEHALHVLGADSLRWQGFKRALETPDRPDLSDPHIGGPLARRLALEGFDEASRPT
jgi:hypothetical protein